MKFEQPYRVYFTNLGWFADTSFASETEAVEYAKQKCFEATIYNENTPIKSWSPIGGVKTL